ncbi:ATP-binding protein [Gynurincola endophyticus]|uniref:ATP-binding protein n=1 Tax=Gynurincola endophyticus TaxID=2479004 RepID=UPI000F8DE8D7|nr:ATP-binding protein [Gynurincola endophyticus]
MNIKDIVNRDIVNLTNCEQEPIHIPGSIQPHGFLLGLKEDEFVIDFCSANTDVYLMLLHTQLLGKSFRTIFGDENADKLRQYIVEQNLTKASGLLALNMAGTDFLCTVHQNEQKLFILEGEPAIQPQEAVSKVYDQTSQFFSYMQDTNSLKELCQLVAEGTRRITGYDRVMIYRFDKDYNGEVFAESCREDLESFLGLHYPHTDIPPQARELYLKNLLRLITDVDYTPVPIYTIDDTPSKNLDLSLSVLRSTSPIHVQYLQNMGVGATLTISLIYKKKLWGLIACHHYSAKNLTPELRLAAQLQGHFITSQIDVRQSSEEYELVKKTNTALEKMHLLSLRGEEDLTLLIEKPEILSLCNAAGVSIQFNGTVYKSGLTPDDGHIKALGSWAAEFTRHTTFNTENLSDYLPQFKGISPEASGIIYHSLDIDSENCIIWYRPETKTEVNWGGDPSKSIIKDQNGLSPRRSFALWKEIVNSTSKPWWKPELEVAAAYAYSLQRQINLLIITQEEKKYRVLSEQLREMNSELENINWISTHDLQEPLRKIQLTASYLLRSQKELPAPVEDSVKRMSNSANRMQTLLIDILKYTKLRHSNDSLQPIDFKKVMEEVKLDLAESIAEKEAEIQLTETIEIKGMPFLIKQLLTNLVSNSIKYSHTDRKPVVTITRAKEPAIYQHENTGTLYNVIHVSDNGTGFEPEYNEKVFKLFTRLQSDQKGSGLGLALCKKIMQNHKGHISANSELNKGTTISLFFPA